MTLLLPRRVWEQLSLTARLMLVSGTAMLLLGLTYFSLVIKSEIEFYADDLRERVRYEMEFITPAVTEPAVVGDYNLIRQMLDVRVKQPYISRIAWVDSRGNRIESKENNVPRLAPRWFER